ncbi:MAG TPA: hypothetical protein VIV60_22920 [Polyangiaceae bacterium]
MTSEIAERRHRGAGPDDSESVELAGESPRASAASCLQSAVQISVRRSVSFRVFPKELLAPLAATLALASPLSAFAQASSVSDVSVTSPPAASSPDAVAPTADIPPDQAPPDSTAGAPAATPNQTAPKQLPADPAAVTPMAMRGAAPLDEARTAPSAAVDLHQVPAAQARMSAAPESTSPIPSGWHFGGYGELLLATTFYHPDLKVNDSSYRDTHLDLTRLSLFVGNDISKRISFSSEIEFEHGGTGTAREIEWEEFGEYETEVEKGGEIVLEQAYLEGRPTDWLTLRAGHLLVPVGMTTTYHMPTMFSSTHRPESESQLLPSIWHENGVEVAVRAAAFTLRGQAITGLDSTGFSSNRWIAGGTQRAFERPLINDPALVFAVDYLGVPGAVVGASFYSSGSNRNRPKRDLYATGGRVSVGELHFRLQQGPLKLRGLALLGHLQNAAAITRANAGLSSELGASRTAVASGVYAAWAEAAYDVLPLMTTTEHRLDVFARFDAYDSMWRAGADFDNPLLQRRTLTAGLNYFPHPRVVIKGEYVSRWLNERRQWDRHQTEANAALGFVL